MKKVYKIFALMLALIFALGVVCYADDTAPADEISDIAPGEDVREPLLEENELTGEATDVTTSEPEETGVGFIDRLKQSSESGELWEMLSVAAAFGMLLLSALLKKTFKTIGERLASLITSGNSKINNSADEMSRILGSSAAALHELERRMENKMDELCEKFSVQTVTHEQVEKLEAMVTSVMDMFDTVYQGSSTIPAITKERIAEIRSKAVAQLKAPEGETRNDESN